MIHSMQHPLVLRNLCPQTAVHMHAAFGAEVRHLRLTPPSAILADTVIEASTEGDLPGHVSQVCEIVLNLLAQPA